MPSANRGHMNASIVTKRPPNVFLDASSGEQLVCGELLDDASIRRLAKTPADSLNG